MSRVIVLRLAAVFFGLILFWGVAEVACRLIFSQVVAYDVEMWRYAREVKVTGMTPGLRFEHLPNAHAHLMGVDVAINSDGLRDREFPRQKTSGTLRIAVVGDSVTFGWGVPQGETYPKQLELFLNQAKPLGSQISFEVLNFGVGNYTAIDAAAMLQHKALKYDPDLVIYGAFINDAENPREAVGGPSFLRHSLAAVLIWGRLDRFWRQVGVREDYQAYYKNLYREDSDGRQRVRSALEWMAALCNRAGIPLVVAMLPELHDPQGALFLDIRAFYRSFSIASGAHFVDLQDSLPDNQWLRYWVSADDAHPNGVACGHYARALSSELTKLFNANRATFLSSERPE